MRHESTQQDGTRISGSHLPALPRHRAGTGRVILRAGAGTARVL